MRVCVLLTTWFTGDEIQPPFPDGWGSPRRYHPDWEWRHEVIAKATAVEQVLALLRGPYDVFVNLCDGPFSDGTTAGVEVIHALERANVPFTGASSECFEPPRTVMKRACGQVGLLVPGWAEPRGGGEAESVAARLGFPLIVKHPSSYASVGLRRASCVADVASLAAEIDGVASRQGTALVEQFIEGREFTVLVAEGLDAESPPRTYPPIEFTFPPGESFRHSDVKWVDYDRVGAAVVADEALNKRIRDAGSAMFTALRASGYGRVDLRLDASGRLFVLEINPNCGPFNPPGVGFLSADFSLAHDPAGPRGFLEHIVACASRRVRDVMWTATWCARFGEKMEASRALPSGTAIVRGEGQLHRVRAKSAAPTGRPVPWSRHDWRRDVGGAWLLRGDDPGEWVPFTHNCAPNARFEGLDLVAVRDIAQAETIAIDFSRELSAFEPFACACGNDGCRGLIAPA